MPCSAGALRGLEAVAATPGITETGRGPAALTGAIALVGSSAGAAKASWATANAPPSAASRANGMAGRARIVAGDIDPRLVVSAIDSRYHVHPSMHRFPARDSARAGRFGHGRFATAALRAT